MDEFLKQIPTVINVLTTSDAGRTVTLLGSVILFLGIYLSFRLVEKKPDGIERWQKWLAFGIVLFGTVFLCLGAGFILFRHGVDLAEQSQVVVNGLQRAENLRINRKVSRVIRLVTYTDNSSEKQVERLQYLGLKNQRYTFVADYDEVKGKTAAEAVRMTGVALTPGRHVSAVIFPAPDVLIPVNARGLLQIISDVAGDTPNKDSFDVRAHVSSDAWNDLSSRRAYSYAFENYKGFFGQYCNVVVEFKCGKITSESQFIGDLRADWNPLGFAGTDVSEDLCRKEMHERICRFFNWDSDIKPYLDSMGVRVFVVLNTTAIFEIKGRMLIDFDEPDVQRIPFIP